MYSFTSLYVYEEAHLKAYYKQCMKRVSNNTHFFSWVNFGLRRQLIYLSFFLSLFLTHTHTLCIPYVYIYVSRMDFNHTRTLFTYEYDTNIGVWVWHEWDVWLELWLVCWNAAMVWVTWHEYKCTTPVPI